MVLYINIVPNFYPTVSIDDRYGYRFKISELRRISSVITISIEHEEAMLKNCK